MSFAAPVADTDPPLTPPPSTTPTSSSLSDSSQLATHPLDSSDTIEVTHPSPSPSPEPAVDISSNHHSGSFVDLLKSVFSFLHFPSSVTLSHLVLPFCLCITTFIQAASGPAFLYMEQHWHTASVLALVWRSIALQVLLLPPTIYELMHLKANWLLQWGEDLTWKTWIIKQSPTVETKQEPPQNGPNGTNDIEANRDSKKPSPIVEQPASTPASTFSALLHSYLPARHHAFWYLMVVGSTWFFSTALWIISLSYTSAARAALFSQLYPLIILVYVHFTTHSTIMGEWIGMLISVIGIVLTEVLSSSSSSSNQSNELIGDMMCIGSSVVCAVNIVATARSASQIPLWTFTSFTNIWLIIWGIPYTALAEGSNFSLSDYSDSIIGFFYTPWPLLFVIVFAAVMGYGGVGMSNFCLSFCNPIVYSAFQLLQPGITGLQSWGAELQALPDQATWIGIGVICGGIAVMVVSEEFKGKKEEHLKVAQEGKKPADIETVAQNEVPQHSHHHSHPQPHKWMNDNGFIHHYASIYHPRHKFHHPLHIRNRMHY